MTGRRTGSFVAIVALRVGAAACVYGAGVSGAGCGGDAFTTGPGDDSDDAASPTVDGAIHDGGISDASGDGGKGWCATQGSHTFCEDFYNGVPDQLVAVAPTGSIAADPKDYESPPESMATSVPTLGEGGTATAFATHDLSNVAGTQFTVSSYFKVDDACFPTTGSTSGGGTAVTVMALNFSAAHYELAVAILPSSVELVEIATDADGGNPTVEPQAMPATIAGSWQDITLELDGAPTGKNATLMIGNAKVFTAVPLKNAPPLSVLEHAQVFFGVSVKNDSTDTSPACKVGVDDILVDVTTAAVANKVAVGH